MRKYSTIIIIAILAIALANCATQSILPPEIAETAKAVCQIYENAKPRVVAFREWAKSVWDETVPGTDQPMLPANVKAILLEFNSYLPTLDSAGQAVCGFVRPGSAPPAAEVKAKKPRNWDRIFAVTLQVVDFALQFHSSRQVSAAHDFYIAPARLRVAPDPEWLMAIDDARSLRLVRFDAEKEIPAKE